MRNDFCVFILSNRRPDNIKTLETLQRSGYTGKWYIVIDDEDPTGNQYKATYGDNVLVFSKAKIAQTTDSCDTSTDRRTPLWARNACWHLAKQVNCRFFCQLDDDYSWFAYRRIGRKNPAEPPKYSNFKAESLDIIFDGMVQFLQETPSVSSIAFSQGGDYNTDSLKARRVLRKAMNSFFCDSERPFQFIGKFNDDVNTYISHGATGKLFLTYCPIQLEQVQTQKNKGGITEAYKESGTYVKSFYTVMISPSSTWIELMGHSNPRLHHTHDWNKVCPKIIHQKYRRESN
jgi:hypothetical protein